MMDMKITAKRVGFCNTTYTFFPFIITLCQILFLAPPHPLGRKKIPSHYLLIFQPLKPSARGIIITTTFFSHMPLQPKFKVTDHDNTVW